MADDKTTTSNELFRVNDDGIPTFDMLEKAQCHLGVTLHAARKTALDLDDEGAWGVVYLLENAKSLMDCAVAKYLAEDVSQAAA